MPINPFVSYEFHYEGDPWPAYPDSVMYQYLFGSKGTYLRAERGPIEACLLVNKNQREVKGLASIHQYLRLPKVPIDKLRLMLYVARKALPNEELYVLERPNNDWLLHRPYQIATPDSVRPKDPLSPVIQSAYIEMHSHNTMPAFFSPTDNNDEIQGMRIYGVIGKIDTKHPQIKMRIGIYGQFWPIPFDSVFDLSEGQSADDDDQWEDIHASTQL